MTISLSISCGLNNEDQFYAMGSWKILQERAHLKREKIESTQNLPSSKNDINKNDSRGRLGMGGASFVLSVTPTCTLCS